METRALEPGAWHVSEVQAFQDGTCHPRQFGCGSKFQSQGPAGFCLHFHRVPLWVPMFEPHPFVFLCFYTNPSIFEAWDSIYHSSQACRAEIPSRGDVPAPRVPNRATSPWRQRELLRRKRQATAKFLDTWSLHEPQSNPGNNSMTSICFRIFVIVPCWF